MTYILDAKSTQRGFVFYIISMIDCTQASEIVQAWFGVYSLEIKQFLRSLLQKDVEFKNGLKEFSMYTFNDIKNVDGKFYAAENSSITYRKEHDLPNLEYLKNADNEIKEKLGPIVYGAHSSSNDVIISE